MRKSAASNEDHDNEGFESATVDIADLEVQTFTDAQTKRGSDFEDDNIVRME